MIYVALIEGVALVATALSFLGVIRSLTRQSARERNLLLNQIMHLTGKTWTAPPSAEPFVEPEPRATVRNPEQYPDGFDFELEEIA